MLFVSASSRNDDNSFLRPRSSRFGQGWVNTFHEGGMVEDIAVKAG